jgi:hypothetical protein
MIISEIVLSFAQACKAFFRLVLSFAQAPVTQFCMIYGVHRFGMHYHKRGIALY